MFLRGIMESIRKGYNYFRKNGMIETMRAFFHRVRFRFRRVKIDASAKTSLLVVLEYLKISQPVEQVITALIKKSGWEKTSWVLADIVQVEKFLISQKNQPVQQLINASQLPAVPASAPRRKILFITAEFPSHHHGGGNRVLNFIKTLAAENDIYLCTAYSADEHEKLLPILDSYCQKILKIPYGRFEGNQAQIRKWLGAIDMDVVHYEWPRSLENFDKSFGRLQIFTYMEAVSLRLLMDMERLTPLSTAWVEKLEQLAYALRLELVQASAVNTRVAVTTKDAEFFRKLSPSQEYVILNHGLGFEEFTLPEVPPEPNTLVFVGNYLHYPNAEAVEFFFNEIWKNIQREIPDVRIYLVGTNPTDFMKHIADNKHVIVTGTVEDVRPYIQKATVCIAPLISGAGLRGKVIEYAALHRPFVATSIASTDLAFVDGTDYFCENSALGFSDKVITLLKNRKLADQMADCAYRTARLNYDNQRLTGFLLSLYNYLEKNIQ